MANVKVELKLTDNSTLTVDKYNGLREIESLSQSTGQPKEVYYGSISNSGTCEINDTNGEILNYIKDGLIPNANAELKVYVNGKEVQEHMTVDSEYTNAQTLKLDMQDWLSKLDDVKTTWYDGDYTSKRLSDVINKTITELQGLLGKTISISSALLSRANNVVYQYICLPVMTYRELVDKLCYANRMNLIQTDDGNLQFVDAATTRDTTKPVIKITPNQVVGDITRDVIVKNKVERVNFTPAQLTVVNHGVFRSDVVEPSIDYSTAYITPTSFYNEQTQQETSTGVTYYSDVFRAEFYYITGSITIPKSSNIKTVDSWTYTVKGKKRTSLNIPTAGYYNKTHGSIVSSWSASTSPLNPSGIGASFADTSYTEINSPLTQQTKVYSAFGGQQYTLTAPAQNSVSRGDTSTNYVLNYRFTIHQAFFHQRASHGLLSDVYNTLNLAEGESRDIEEITFNIAGQNMTITLDTESIFYGTQYTTNEVNIPPSELITTTNLGNSIANAIRNDYINGISTVKLTISCLNMYDIDNNLKKDFINNGEILQVGDYVTIHKDFKGTPKYIKPNGSPYIWKVVGRNFRCEGVPLIDLTLQELK